VAGSSSDVMIVSAHGPHPGYVTSPRAVAFSGTRDLIVIDRSGRVQVFDAMTGEYRSRWMLERYDNGTPTGISVDPEDGTLWVADTHNQRIIRFTTDGTILSQWGEYGNRPGEMVFPTDVCPDPDGETLWVTEYGIRSRIMHFTRDGRFLKEWGSGEYQYEDLSRPQAIAVGDDGLLYVVDSGNHRINVYTREGEKVRTIGEPGKGLGELQWPIDLQIAADGSIYVVEFNNSRVSRFDREGRFMGIWGRPGFGAGELFSPWGVAIGTDGRMAIADTYNNRIHVLTEPERRFSVAEERS
jgi:DNA-binding beta-propeller fold protein YncE